MPIAIDQLDSSVDVQSPATPGDSGPEDNPAEAMQRFQQLAQRQRELAARTAAWNFDD